MTSLSDQRGNDYRLPTAGDGVKLSFHTDKMRFTSVADADGDPPASMWRPDWFPNEKRPIFGP